MYTIWHNPRCRNSRGSLEKLKEKGIEPEVRLYLEDAPTHEELKYVAEMLGRKPIEFTRTKEDAWKESGLSKDSSDEEIFCAMAENPILIERPIIMEDDKRAMITRPPELVEEFV